MFVRFVIHKNDEGSGRRQGLFQALSDLEYAGALLAHEQEQYDEIYDWFRKRLKKPRSFTRSSKPHAKKVALSWYKDTAVEHIAKMHALAQILQDHGVVVDVLRSERPGYVVYEDEFQVAAEPFKETMT
jgi:D-alanyl-D-alanine dipeptidase